MHSVFTAIYKLIINFTVTLLGIIVFCAMWFAGYLLFKEFYFQIPFIILGLVVAVLSGSYLHVLLRIPFDMPEQFDEIKNKVALQAYDSVEDFQQEIGSFLINFFRFSGADIYAGYFKFNGAEPLFLNVDIDIDQVLESDGEKIKRTKISKDVMAFYVPVVIGNKQLGKMILLTKGTVLPFMENVLEDFENYYLDDQLLHVINQHTK